MVRTSPRGLVHRAPIGLIAAVILGLGLVGFGGLVACGTKTSDADSADVVKIDITESNGSIEPKGDTVTAHTGQDITLVIKSDRDDEIHVHSDPEHEIEVVGGKTKTATFTIDTPGTYDVESHGLDVVVVKLQIS
jgi:plastocyanin